MNPAKKATHLQLVEEARKQLQAEVRKRLLP